MAEISLEYFSILTKLTYSNVFIYRWQRGLIPAVAKRENLTMGQGRERVKEISKQNIDDENKATESIFSEACS